MRKNLSRLAVLSSSLAVLGIVPACGSTGGNDGGAGGGTATGGGTGSSVTRTIESSSGLVIFADPFADGGPNPLTGDGGVVALEYGDGRTNVRVSVGGAPANRSFGSHVHILGCSDMKGGGHYQNNVFTTTATDPAFANPTNEFWLDFTTDATGNGLGEATVNFLVRDGGARSVIIHANPTGDGGVAGARLGCISVPF